jgi:hypothetical protein
VAELGSHPCREELHSALFAAESLRLTLAPDILFGVVATPLCRPTIPPHTSPSVETSVLRDCKALKILELRIGLVKVLVMDLVARRNWSMSLDPYCMVQRIASLISPVATIPVVIHDVPWLAVPPHRGKYLTRQ